MDMKQNCIHLLLYLCAVYKVISTLTRNQVTVKYYLNCIYFLCVYFFLEPNQQIHGETINTHNLESESEITEIVIDDLNNISTIPVIIESNEVVHKRYRKPTKRQNKRKMNLADSYENISEKRSKLIDLQIENANKENELWNLKLKNERELHDLRLKKMKIELEATLKEINNI